VAKEKTVAKKENALEELVAGAAVRVSDFLQHAYDAAKQRK